MGWLRKAQSIPPFGAGTPGGSAPNGPVQGRAFLDIVTGQQNPLYPEPNFTNNAHWGYEKNELVYACVMEKATSLPEAPFRVFGPDGQGESRENHPLRVLMANPNPATTEFELIELTSIYLDLAGIAFWEIVSDRAGRPVELWPLRPDLVRIFPRQNGRHEYGYDLGQNRVIPLGTDVISFTYPNPMDPIMGQAPMRSANRAVALDNEATDFVKALLQNRAVPGTVIETEQKIDDVLTERLTAKWIERFGRQNRGAPAFLQKGMKVHTLGLDLGELEFPDLRTISESRICMSFGVPPILVGAKVGLDRSTFANYAEARRSLWEETLMPLQKRMEQVIVSKLMPRFDGPRPRRTVARFDNSEVLALRESEGRRWELGTQALRAGGITRNQFHRYVGLPIDSEGDIYYLPAGVVPMTVDNKPASPEFAPKQPGDSTPPPDPADSGGDPSQDPPAVDDAAKVAAAIVAHAIESKATPPSAPNVPKLAADVAALVGQQRDEVMPRIDRDKSLLALAPERYNATDLWSNRRWNHDLAQCIEPWARLTACESARKLALDAPVDELEPKIIAASEALARRWNKTTREQLQTALALGGSEAVDTAAAAFVAAAHRSTDIAEDVIAEMTELGQSFAVTRLGLA